MRNCTGLRPCTSISEASARRRAVDSYVPGSSQDRGANKIKGLRVIATPFSLAERLDIRQLSDIPSIVRSPCTGFIAQQPDCFRACHPPDSAVIRSSGRHRRTRQRRGRRSEVSNDRSPMASTAPTRSHRRPQKLTMIANGYSRSSTMLGDSRPTPNPHRPLRERVI